MSCFWDSDSTRYTIDEIQELNVKGEVLDLEVIGVVQNIGVPANRTGPARQAFLV